MTLTFQWSPTSSEAPYSFRGHLETVHAQGRRDPAGTVHVDEVLIDSSWTILFEATASGLVEGAAVDLSEYLSQSMGEVLEVREASPVVPDGVRTIHVASRESASALTEERGYVIQVAADRVVVTGLDDRMTAQACYFIEDLMNLRRIPALSIGDQARTRIFSPRLTHSGLGTGQFPDAYLARIAHAGMDGILVFAMAPNRTLSESPDKGGIGRHLDFSDLARRCEAHGLDMYFYSAGVTEAVHPDDAEASEYFERVFGALFKECPTAKGIVVVGETSEFPSSDPNTTGRLRNYAEDTLLPGDVPSPGYWPSSDYPKWVSGLRDACRKHRPDAEIIFWTYNWGWAPTEDRLRLINGLPDDITVQATFEMFEPFRRGTMTGFVSDYTISEVGPGHYFASEAAAVHDRGMKLATIANTGGLTWDFGVIGYVPCVMQWADRLDAVRRAHNLWGLSGLMENHSYGWYPSVVSELAKFAAWDPSPPLDWVIERLAERDFGPGAESAKRAWELWSSAMRHYVPTEADQYGPFRIGTSYPLTFAKVPTLSMPADAIAPPEIVRFPYRPDLISNLPMTATSLRIGSEIDSLEQMLRLWQSGMTAMTEARELAGTEFVEPARMDNLGAYIGQCIATAVNAKRWWRSLQRLLVADQLVDSERLLDELVTIAESEFQNSTQSLVPLSRDSRLGWAPDMGYIGGPEQVQWKLAHLRRVLDHEIPAYRRGLFV